MVRVEIKGLAKVEAKGRTYWYAWRGGPRLCGEPGSPEFMASYNEAIENRRTPDKSRFRFVVADYKGSAEYKKLAKSTRAQWGKWLDRIADYFGDLRIAQFDRPDKIRPVIRRWRNQCSIRTDRPGVGTWRADEGDRLRGQGAREGHPVWHLRHLGECRVGVGGYRP